MDAILQKFSNLKVSVLGISIGYILLLSLLEDLRIEHWSIVILFNSFIWISPQTRRLLLALAPFVVFGILYDLLKLYPNYKLNPVDISGIYNFDKTIFGFYENGKLISLNEFFALHHHWFSDFVSGLFYINWMPVPIVFGIWLYIKNKRLFLEYSLAFLFVNLIGFTIYYIHPAAPPWYVAKYGFSLNLNTGGETAGLARFDDMIKLNLFASIYSRNSNVFAALPSLHCAYPVIVLFYALKAQIKNMRWLLVLFMLGIWFSAVYSGHHYAIDVIAGILCAMAGLFVFQKLLLKCEAIQKWIGRYLILIEH